MSSTPSISEVARKFAEYINRVVFRGDRFLRMRAKPAVAELRRESSGKKLRELPELLASLPRLSEAEAADLAADLDHTRGDLTRARPRDTWAS
jgi:hypothetical protein